MRAGMEKGKCSGLQSGGSVCLSVGLWAWAVTFRRVFITPSTLAGTGRLELAGVGLLPFSKMG